MSRERLLTGARWAAAAILGLLLAVALAVGTLRLTDQHVGLSAEPTTAGGALVSTVPAPPTTTTTTTTSATTTATTPTATATTPGGAGGDGEGEGGDD